MGAAAYYHQAEIFSLPAISPEERERLILDHLPQVRLVARRIHERLPDSVCFDDLLSAGVLGLIQAIDNFDPSQNVKLKTFAEFRIRGSILDSLREGDWAPRLKRKQARDFETAIARAEQRLGRLPDESEIAAELRLSVEVYRQKLTEMEGLNIGELEYVRDDSPNAALLKFVASPEDDSPEATLARSEIERLIASSIDRIPKAERTVLSLYFYEDLTLREIAEIMNLHFTRVSQLKSQAILRLRSALGQRFAGVKYSGSPQ